VGATGRDAKKKGAYAIEQREHLEDLPADDPVKAEYQPLLDRIRDLSWYAWRCRVVNRAFGTNLTPDVVARTVPDETIDLLATLLTTDQIDDTQTMIRLALERR
jgi:hypothetical protein